MRKYMKEVAVALMTKSTIFAPTLTANSLSLSRPRPPPTFASHSITTMINNQEQQHQLEDTNLDAIFKQKKLLRSRVRKQLKAMDPTLRSQEGKLSFLHSNNNDEIQRLVLEAPWFKSCQRLCAYITCKALREVDTSKVLYEILANPAKDGHTRKKLYVPRVEDKNSNMRMLNISSLDDLVANSMDILEPAPVDGNGNKREDGMALAYFITNGIQCLNLSHAFDVPPLKFMQANDPVDLFLLPGLAFDRSGRRLGRGGGYYDTFLKNYKELAGARNWKQPLLVALSYSLQIVDEGSIPVTQNDIPVDALVSPAGVIPISSAALDRYLQIEGLILVLGTKPKYFPSGWNPHIIEV
ncbi:hypothetical protein FEM48_Zijuj05G0082600 [Ziziphus jujuba var. spinosa]|uniref:5-formyltetrahydrofolate cyclo-ligase n=1 Tax=Ziziphus jujuba var. spinosa TaxID=714518 RepID=A0A978VDU8_ZIZJJ|nr:hypothetical protein FEM48_Zijuj05G0082600 [Ziziphus jujuba var. spinosa]